MTCGREPTTPKTTMPSNDASASRRCVRVALSRSIGGALLALAAGAWGCGDSGHGPDERGVVARLTATESASVPGRIELDGSRSSAGEERSLASHTYTIWDRKTGEIVYGPVERTQSLGQARIRTYLPAGDYVGALTVRAGSVSSPSAALAGAQSEDDSTDTAEVDFSLDAQVNFSTTDCGVTCSQSSSSDSLTCTLSTTSGCYTVDLEDVLASASSLDSDVDEYTKMWIEAYGGSGGGGAECFNDGGSGGAGGFAQTTTAVIDFEDSFSTSTLYYYVGGEGGYENGSVFGGCGGTGGTGGASTIVAITEPTSGDYLDEDDLIVLAGGGGGGGIGSAYGGGNNGGRGGSAIASIGYPESAAGEDSDGSGGNGTGAGDGGTGYTPDEGEGGGDGGSGIGGVGGAAGNSDYGDQCLSSPGWVNETPSVDGDAGAGGYGQDCNSGAGGGGYGGGGGGGTSGLARNGGGGGGGSYATSSVTGDGSPPSDYQSHTGDGEVVIRFDVD